MTTEAAFQRKVVKWLKAHDCLVYKFSSPSCRGVPDLIVITPSGDSFFIELKNPSGKGKLSKLQEQRIAELRGHNVLVLVTHDFDFLCNWVTNLMQVFKHVYPART